MDILTALGLVIPAGLNAYIPLLGLALAERFGVVSLGEPWNVMAEWWVIAIIAVLLVVELLADKIPAVDTVNDAIQTFLRPAAGAVLMVAASGKAGDNYPIAMVVLGIVVAGSVHAVKASARPVVNATTGGTGAPVVSTAEDVFAAGATFVAIVLPVLVVFIIIGFIALAWWIYRRRRRSMSASD